MFDTCDSLRVSRSVGGVRSDHRLQPRAAVAGKREPHHQAAGPMPRLPGEEGPEGAHGLPQVQRTGCHQHPGETERRSEERRAGSRRPPGLESAPASFLCPLPSCLFPQAHWKGYKQRRKFKDRQQYLKDHNSDVVKVTSAEFLSLYS